MRKGRILIAIVFGLCAVGVDFTSTLFSVVSDLIFVSLIFLTLWPLLDGRATDE